MCVCCTRMCLCVYVCMWIFFLNYFSLGWCSCISIVDDASTLLCFYIVGFKTCPIVAVKVRLNSAQFISPYLLSFHLTLSSLAYLTRVRSLYAKSSVTHHCSPPTFLIIFNDKFSIRSFCNLTLFLDMQ